VKLTPLMTGVAPSGVGILTSTLHVPPSAYLSANASTSSSSLSTSMAKGSAAARTLDLDKVVKRRAAPGRDGDPWLPRRGRFVPSLVPINGGRQQQ
jgi:hypothetical protein